MSVATLAALIAKLRNPSQLPLFIKNGQAATGTHFNSEWVQPGFPAAASIPGTTAAICDRTTAGALGQGNKLGTEQRAWLRRFGSGGAAANLQGALVLVDRLAHVGGLSGIVTTAQTVAFPALTRSTSGAGCWAAAEIYTNVGATGTTATISYSNTVPTAGQTSPAIVFGGTGFSNVRSVLPFGYASGDVGVTAVASVTLAATTGTAGNFGVSLFKTLGWWPLTNSGPYGCRGIPVDLPGPMPVIPDDACLQFLHFSSGQVASIVTAQMAFFED